MAEVVDFASVRAERQRGDDHPPFALIGYLDSMLLEGHDRPWTADELRKVATDLRFFTRWLNDRANELEGKEPDQILVDAVVYESGRITTWASERIETAEQAGWAVRQLAKAEIGLPA